MGRVIASQMGMAAVEGLIDGQTKVMTGLNNKKIEMVPLEKSIKHHKSLNQALLRMLRLNGDLVCCS